MIEQIVAAVDWDAHIHDVIRCGEALRDDLGVAPLYVHVIDPDASPERQQRTKQSLAAAGASPLTLVAGEVADEVAALAGVATLLIIGPHQSDLLTDLFGRSTAETLAREDTHVLCVASHGGPAAHKRIVIGTDCSPTSGCAIEAALGLFPEAEIHIVHVWDVPYKAFLGASATQDDVYAEHERGLDDFLSTVPGGDELKKRSRLRQGEPISVLVQQMRDLNADLLVIGARGESGRAVGANARQFLKSPPCDVLVVV